MKVLFATNGTPVKVDDEDYKYLILFTWHITSHGYVATRHKGKFIYMHRLVADAKEDELVDHKDHDKTNNQKSNLRKSNRSTNAMNTAKTERRKSSVFKGVSFDKARNLWVAKIKFNGKQIFLGRFVEEVEAAKAYNAKALELFGEFAYLNDIPEVVNSEERLG